MKKGISILLVLAMLISVFAFAACGETDEPAIETEVQETETETQETEAETQAPGGALRGSFTRRQVTDGITTFYVVENPGDGPTLSFAADSGIELIVIEYGGYELAFLDLSNSGVLEPWEDWRLPSYVRAADLVTQLTVEQLSGLMLFSGHTNSDDLMTAAHQGWIQDNHMRLILNAGASYVEQNVQWNNQMQAFAQSIRSADTPLIPINIASDPRSTAGAAIYDAAGDISGWPGNLGLAATFNEQYMLNFAQMASAEYRALGITTALSPQVDLATDPRWIRNEGTLGEDLAWARRLAAVYVDGFQGSYGLDVWGTESVTTMIKHFGGDGPNEGGRIAHMYPGMFDVFPGGGQYDHFNVFADAMHSAGVMTGFPIAIDRDGNPLWSTETRDRDGNIINVPGGLSTGFNVDVMNFLRQNLGFEGAIVTDWAVTNNPGFLNTGWGTLGEEFLAPWAIVPAADLTPEILEEQRLAIGQRVFVLLVNGTDMFGGLNFMQPVAGGDWTQNRPEDQGGPITVYNVDGAFQMWQRAYELGNLPIDARTRWEESGVRILANFFFATGLYENPFLVLEESLAVVGAPEKQAAGFEAQLASVVMLKNDGVVGPSTMADWANMTVYVPASKDIGWGGFGPPNETSDPTLEIGILEHFFGTVLTDEIVLDGDGNVIEFIPPSDAELANVDIVLVGMQTPNNGTMFSNTGFSAATQTWHPLSLQWGPYVADGPYVRQVSISGVTLPDGTRQNRSYFGNEARISNAEHLVSFQRAAAIAADLDVPVITLLHGFGSATFVPVEIYDDSNAILIGWGVSDQALIEVGLGLREASGRLPITMPANMDAVERQLEDIADTDPFIDSNGNAWGFGFGLNFSGPIN